MPAFRCWSCAFRVCGSGMGTPFGVAVAGSLAVITRNYSLFINCRVPQHADANVVVARPLPQTVCGDGVPETQVHRRRP
ncbi:hypothetical protein N658DRAFT_64721 [Parathielavia hyrcaniae]|uniref:Uncharacterized protein n=1 Tax=Parathielavia hyrcaniae TaxID=113614 RepID=A0AAN6PQF5_9PEZI|nr:hypothetical protein N658DRAFT_64721 [Parathielavia hyrcaniae]